MSDDFDFKEAAEKEENSQAQNNYEQLALQEEYLKAAFDLEEGQLLKGKVIEITPEFVFVDVGYKSEGKVSIEEFKTKPNLGDMVDVLLLNKEGRNGQIVVSKKRADEIIFSQRLMQAYRQKLPINATVIKKVKGGFEALVEDLIPAFIPFSQIDSKIVKNEDKYLGLKTLFLIEEYHRGQKKRLVLSRRKLQEDEALKRKEKFMAEAKEGDIVEGTVKSFTAFGVFIDLNGFDGLLHISDMSWGRINKPKDLLKKGDRVKAVIKSIDRQKQKINLSLKDLTENPWHSADKRYKVGDLIEGKVLRLTDFGAFVEVEPGIEGLVHISELSWIKRVNHPKEVLQIGQKLKVKVLGVEKEKEKLSLSLKSLLPNPWNDLEDRYPVGSRLKRVVKEITENGAVFEIEEGIDGFLHVDDISWTQKIKNSNEVFKVGAEIEVMVLNINKKEKKVRLGIKQLSEDPWKALAAVFKVGNSLEAEVKELTENGMKVQVQGELEGFIKRAQLFDPAIENFEELKNKYKPGVKIKAIITELDPKKKRLQLSVREYFKQIQAEELGKYLHDEENESDKTTLAEFLKIKNNKE